MFAKQQKSRGGWKDSSDRKVSPVEAAHVVESYLIEQNFTKTLTEFRNEAATILITMKNRPKHVKSLSNILHDYVVIREERQASLKEKSKLEQAMKEEQMTLLQEKNKFQMLVHQLRENLTQMNENCAIYEAACLPQSTPTQYPVHMLQPAGHSTPPGIGVGLGLSRTPGSATAPLIATPATKKRKNAMTAKTLLQSASIPETSTPNTGPSKKVRHHILPTASPQGAQSSSPWPMCGTVRKTSLNSVRPVQSKSSSMHVPHPTIHDPKALFPKPVSPPAHQKLGMPLVSPLPTSKSLPVHSQAQQLGQQCPVLPAPARTTSSLSSPATRAEDPFHADPKTPTGTPASQSPEHILPDNKCPVDDPHPQSEKEGASEGGSLANKCVAFDQPSLGHQTISQAQPDNSCNQNSINCENSQKRIEVSCSRGQTSPDSRTCAGTRGMKPSKTMRPLDFTSRKSSISEGTSMPPMNFPNHESPSDSHEALAGTPRKDSPAHSSVSHLDYVTLNAEEEHMSQLCTDLESIDDILACLNDASMSDLFVGTMDVCSVDDHPSTESDKNRTLIGEDSFGFHCIVDRVTPQQGNLPELENILSSRDVNEANEGSLKCKASPSPSKRTPALSGLKSIHYASKWKTLADKPRLLLTLDDKF